MFKLKTRNTVNVLHGYMEKVEKQKPPLLFCHCHCWLRLKSALIKNLQSDTKTRLSDAFKSKTRLRPFKGGFETIPETKSSPEYDTTGAQHARQCLEPIILPRLLLFKEGSMIFGPFFPLLPFLEHLSGAITA